MTICHFCCPDIHVVSVDLVLVASSAVIFAVDVVVVADAVDVVAVVVVVADVDSCFLKPRKAADLEFQSGSVKLEPQNSERSPFPAFSCDGSVKNPELSRRLTDGRDEARRRRNEKLNQAIV